ncbi:hypothetical protein PINS_up001135 [Pythium insidiosum]|nr:hypothetical protein PINS_up001135 [Pythium insidiosum]
MARGASDLATTATQRGVDERVSKNSSSDRNHSEKDEELSMTRTVFASDEDASPVGIATNRGGKTNQEDAYFIGGRAPERLTLNGYSSAKAVGCFGLFDGHGGDRASRYCAEHVFDRILAEREQTEDVAEAITKGVLQIDEEFCTIARRKQRLPISLVPSRAQAPVGVACTMTMEDGSTCLVAVLSQGKLYVGNVGDSRAVLCTDRGKAIPMSIDQKPDRKDEKERLEAKGAVVTGLPRLVTQVWPLRNILDVPRVNGSLAMSRSIGDVSLKEWITSEPEVTTRSLTRSDRFLILASDGLWDVVSNRTAAKLAARYPDAQRAADALLQLALNRKTTDNVTVLVVDVRAYT